ncbi:MAG: hypothetical protein BKP49_08680 [Treponema sp. CETP13]|nr:MAG: hypothetical protein BKP49_08680 [Treponema sp. CETP13]
MLEVLLVTVLFLIVLVRVLKFFSPKIKFYLTGVDTGFKISEINLLWSLVKKTNLSNPNALYLSLPSLDRCISEILIKARKTKSEKSPHTQLFLNKLYKYRTKIELDLKKNNQLKTTKSLKQGQLIRIIYPNHGVFKSKIINIGRDIIISMPISKNELLFTENNWINQKISVYLNRQNDAGYVFDTFVKKAIQFNGVAALCLEHTDILTRIQKRQSIRVQTSMFGQIYIDKTGEMNKKSVESLQGLKCLIEDLSEDGALIRTGGKAKPGFSLKLQFVIDEQDVVMYGIIKGVEYNKELNQSRMHFKCLVIDSNMRNIILTFVYNIIPENERAIYEAVQFATNDTSQENNEETEEMKTTEKTNEMAEEMKTTEETSENPEETHEKQKQTEFENNEGIEPLNQSDLEFDTTLFKPDLK